MRGIFWGKVILWAGILLLAGCRIGQPAPILQAPTATVGVVTVQPPTPMPTVTPLPLTITPTPDPYGWNPVGLQAFEGVAAPGVNPQCAASFPAAGEGELLLGADPQTCAPLSTRSEVRLQVGVAGSGAPGEWLSLGIACQGDSACLYGPPSEQARFEVALPDGSLLWAGDCSQPGLCADPGAVSAATAAQVAPLSVQVTLRHDQPGPVEVVLSAQGGAVWRVADIQSLALPPLKEGLIQGYAYSPYRDCQMPDIGPFPSQAQLEEDLHRLANSANAVRTYAAQGINADIARLAVETGLRVGVGVALSAEDEKNQAEIEAARTLAQELEIDFFIVGNEVILRGELTPQQVADYMLQVRQQTGRPVGYAEIGSFFVQPDGAGGAEPRRDMLPIIQAADVLLVHLYPYWDGIPVEQGAAYVLDAYQTLQGAFPDQRIVIGETGWPSRGEVRGPAVPSLEKQRRFFLEFTSLAAAHGMEYYYFSPFEEPWKANEGGVGPSWGVATVGRVNKFESEALYYPRPTPPAVALADWPPAGASPTQAVAQPGAVQAGTPPLELYRQFPFPAGLSPSRWQGDVEDILMDPCWRDAPYSPPESLELRYASQADMAQGAEGWAGFIWETLGAQGSDLSAYNQVRFYARGAQGGEKVTFFFGSERSNLAACQRGTIPCDAQTLPPILPVTLTQDWQPYSIYLGDQPLTSVVDGLGWVASDCQNFLGATFYLDDIELVSAAAPPVGEPAPFTILEDGCLAPGFDLGIDTSEQRRDWASPAEDSIRLEYPVAQDWGAAFIFVDLEEWENRPFIDLSAYSTLEVEMRSDNTYLDVEVGMKDNDDPDNGREPKNREPLRNDWHVHQFPMAEFQRYRYADPARIYIPMELVFDTSWAVPQVVYLRSVRLLP